MQIHTSLAKARGQYRGMVFLLQRLNERQPMPVREIPGNDVARAAYLLKTASVHYSSGCPKKALGALRESFVLACRHRYLANHAKKETAIKDPRVFLVKLRSSTFLRRDEFDALRRLLTGCRPNDIFEIVHMAHAVAKVVFA